MGESYHPLITIPSTAVPANDVRIAIRGARPSTVHYLGDRWGYSLCRRFLGTTLTAIKGGRAGCTRCRVLAGEGLAS